MSSAGLPADDVVQQGILFVPQGNRVFTELTVRENLEIGGYLLGDERRVADRMERVLGHFPDLREHLKQGAGVLSGGEKQQLALARALMLEPRVLLLDEPSLGLSPRLVTKAFETIQIIRKELKTTVLIVEQKVHEVMKIADRIYALRMGGIVFTGTPAELQQGDRLREIFLV